MVKRIKDQKLRLRNVDARHEKTETGAVVKSRSGLSGIDRGKGVCYEWKAKGQCSSGDQCSFRHESNDRAKPTPKAAPPEPQSLKTRGRSVSRKRNARGRSQSVKFNRPPCKYFLKVLPCNRNVSSALSAHFLIGRLKSNPTKNRRRMKAKVQ